MESLWIIIVLGINFAISWWNAYACGKMWIESKTMGGFSRLLVWCGATMSAIGFSSVYIFILILGVFYGQTAFLKPQDPLILTKEMMEGAFSLWYLAIIIPALGSGTIIWAHSLVEAWKRKDFASIGTAAWNTFAQAHNTYGAINNIPEALSGIGKLFSSKGDSKGKGLLLIVLLVIIAILGGILTTYALIKKYSATAQLPNWYKEGKTAS